MFANKGHSMFYVAGLFCLLLLRFAACTDIGTFSDTNCQVSSNDLNGPNGFPDGTCTPLNKKGTYGSIMVVGADPGCAVTLYMKNTDSDSCSGAAIVAEIAQCYNSSFQWYSIDECFKPSSSSSVQLPTTAPSSSSSSLSSSSTSSVSSLQSTSLLVASTTGSTKTTLSTAVSSTILPPNIPMNNTSTHDDGSKSTSNAGLIGGVVGGVVVLCALIGLTSWLCYRRRKRPPKPPPKPSRDFKELPDNSLTEMPEQIKPRYELGHGRTESGIPLAELPSGIDGYYDVKDASTLRGSTLKSPIDEGTLQSPYDISRNTFWLPGGNVPNREGITPADSISVSPRREQTRRSL